MKILINNNKSRLQGKTKWIIKLRNHPLFCIRVKGAFFSPAFQTRRWDGMKRYINEAGVLDTGKVFQAIKLLKEWKEPIELIDQRPEAIKAYKIPKEINGYAFRDYQYRCLKAIKNNKLEDLAFPKGIGRAATNAGKTIITTGIYRMYKEDTLYLVNSKELFEQMVEELEQFIPGEVGYISSQHGIVWNKFMVVMVQTAVSRIKTIGPKLAKFKVVIIDECDLATSKTFGKIIALTYNAYVKIGLSGSALVDLRDKIKNENLRGIFGDVLFEITNQDLWEAGWSTKIKAYIWNGNTTIKEKGSYPIEAEFGIIKNKERNRAIVKRTQVHIKKKRLPILIICKHHKHIGILYKKLMKLNDLMGHTLFGLRIDWVHHERKDRREVVKNFKEGKIDILIGSYILKRGKNFPLMRAVINAGGGDSIATILQIIGRATRKHDSKEFTYMDDFYDKGAYIRRHSLHRFTTYKNEGIKMHVKYDRKKL